MTIDSLCVGVLTFYGQIQQALNFHPYWQYFCHLYKLVKTTMATVLHTQRLRRSVTSRSYDVAFTSQSSISKARTKLMFVRVSRNFVAKIRNKLKLVYCN